MGADRWLVRDDLVLGHYGGGNTPAYSDTIRATERWLPEIFFGLWLQIGDFLAHGRN